MDCICWSYHRGSHRAVSALDCRLLPIAEWTTRGAVKASVDGYVGGHFMTCPSVAAATEVYQAYSSLPSNGVDPLFRPTTTTTGRVSSIANTSNTSSEPTASGLRGGGAASAHPIVAVQKI